MAEPKRLSAAERSEFRARMATYVERAVAAAPSLTEDQKADLARILQPRPGDIISEPVRIEVTR